jgi:DNA mismatch repair protein MSH4
VSTLGVENQDIICAVSESRGVSPSVGLAFLNLDTGEAVLSQFGDSQTYVRTIHKLAVFNPNTVLAVSSSAQPKSKLYSIIEDSVQQELDSDITLLDRRYWSETAGLDYINHLAFPEDRTDWELLCCLLVRSRTEIHRAWLEQGLPLTFSPHQVRTIRRFNDD